MWQKLVQQARELGFQSVAATAVAEWPELQLKLRRWLEDGRHGDMAWMARDPERRADPRRVLENAQTIITCTLNYYTEHHHNADPKYGRVSRYAWGDDYHEVMLPKLKQLADFVQTRDPSAESLCYVDTGPIMEKAWAARAGLGWQGKHTNLIDPKGGSWFFVGEIITTATAHDEVDIVTGDATGEKPRGGLAPVRGWAPVAAIAETGFPTAAGPVTIPRRGISAGSCGTCIRCIDVCPTRAITAPYQLDARRCISYLTIEHKGSIPVEMRPLMGNHIYGCDLCQDICPWNRFATATPEPAFQPRQANLNPELIPLLYMTDDEFRTRFKNSPIKRIKRARFLRNVAVALGNSKDLAAVPALQHALHDSEPLIREHAEWALHQIHEHHSMSE